MSLQSGPVITSQGGLINSRMKQATVERAIGDHKWHSHIPHGDHITLCTVSVRWTPETAENVMRVFDPQCEGVWEVEANLLSMHYCFRDVHKKKPKTSQAA